MMIRKVIVLCSLFFFTALSSCASETRLSCRVVGISDGDTLTCLARNNRSIKIRLADIDAPEKRQAFGQKSKQALSNLVFQRQVQLKIWGKDRYQRTLATVYYRGQNINLMMVKQGFAWVYTQYLHDPIYLAEQQHAQAKGIGLWADHRPIEPRLWRKHERLNHGF